MYVTFSFTPRAPCRFDMVDLQHEQKDLASNTRQFSWFLGVSCQFQSRHTMVLLCYVLTWHNKIILRVKGRSNHDKCHANWPTYNLKDITIIIIITEFIIKWRARLLKQIYFLIFLMVFFNATGLVDHNDIGLFIFKMWLIVFFYFKYVTKALKISLKMRNYQN